MVRKLTKDLVQYFKNIAFAEYSERSHQVELVGTYFDEGRDRDVICTVQLKHYIPRDVYGEAGFFYEKPRQRKVRDKNRQWIIINEVVKYYEMSEADKKFVYVSYVYHHLNQRQISKLSGIPQPYVYRYIKHNKLKPKYLKTPRSERNIDLDLETFTELKKSMGLPESTDVTTNYNEVSVEIPEDMDFTQDFHLDPYPTRSEWKVRRENLGLKNGENWRNTPYDENPGPRQYGDGSGVRRRKVAKQARKQKRRIKNIQKFNLHQNNRYKMTKDNPQGIFNPNYKNDDKKGDNTNDK